MSSPPARRHVAAEERRAFRAFVRSHHPDVGGDPVLFMAGLAAWRGGPPTGEVTFFRRGRGVAGLIARCLACRTRGRPRRVI